MADRPGPIVVSGHLCLDLIPQMAGVPLADLATPGRLFEVGPLVMSTGGAVSNTGLALHRLGVDVELMATVGDDLLGGLIIQAIEARDPALSRRITVRPGASSYTVVLSPQNVDRIFLHCAGSNAQFDVEDVNMALLHDAAIFHLGYPPIMPRLVANGGVRLARLYELAHATGVITSLDMSMPDPDGPSGQIDWLPIVQRTLPYVDVFVPSIDEIVFMLRRADYDAWAGDVLGHIDAAYLDDLADELLSYGVAITGFKLSRLGFYVRGGSPERLQRLTRLGLDVSAWIGARAYQPVFQVDVVGTTGAGDAAYAGLLAALYHGLDPAAVVQWAAAVGACNVETADATSGIRTWAATQARLEANWPLSPARVPGL